MVTVLRHRTCSIMRERRIFQALQMNGTVDTSTSRNIVYRSLNATVKPAVDRVVATTMKYFHSVSCHHLFLSVQQQGGFLRHKLALTMERLGRCIIDWRFHIWHRHTISPVFHSTSTVRHLLKSWSNVCAWFVVTTSHRRRPDVVTDESTTVQPRTNWWLATLRMMKLWQLLNRLQLTQLDVQACRLFAICLIGCSQHLSKLTNIGIKLIVFMMLKKKVAYYKHYKQ